MSLLGIDYGLTFLGLAIVREELPQPLVVIRSKSDKHKIEEIIKIINNENISRIIIGITTGKLKSRIVGFANELKKKTNREIIFIDETLSSNQGFIKMIEQQIPQKKRREYEHAFAAVVLLESYLKY